MAQPKRPKASKTNGMTIRKVAGIAARYVTHRDEKKEAEKEMKPLADQLKEYAEALGTENDNGSFVLSLPNGLKVSKVAVTKDVIDEAAAIEILNQHGLLQRCTKTVIDKAAVEQAIAEGALGVDEVAKFTDAKVSFRLDVRA